MELTEKKSTVQEEYERARSLLERMGKKMFAEEDIVFEGDKLILPARMTMTDAINFLHKKVEEDESVIGFSRQYRFRPWDGARATHRALKAFFGSVIHGGNFFNPPELVTIPVGVNETEQVAWGTLEIPVLPGVVFTVGQYRDPEYGILFALSAQGARKHRFAIEGIFNLVAERLAEDSLYRGKAFDGQQKAEFIDTTAVDRRKVVYSDDVLTQLEASVWSLLRHTKKMREVGVPLKRAVLFEGPYGTGKSLGAFLTAQEAVSNGWTFIYCRPAKDKIEDVMATARLYQPAVVFVEDIDTISNPEEETHDGVARLLDLFDGITAKETEILLVLTSNHAKKIHKGMLRPGRLDAVIHIGELDEGGVERMARALVPEDLLHPEIDWHAVGEAMSGFLPAYVTEAVNRAMRYVIVRTGGNIDVLTTEDLVNAGLGLQPQLDLMNAANEIMPPDAFAKSFRAELQKGVEGMKVADSDDKDEIHFQIVAGNGKE